MRSQHLEKIENDVSKDGDLSMRLQKQDFTPGDVTWINVEDSLWWPAQVVDEKTVSQQCKPKKTVSCETLVRLYGTYEYLFIDPIECSHKFENALKQKKVSAVTMFQEALEVISPGCCNHNIKNSLSKSGSEEAAAKEGPKNSKAKKDAIEKIQDANLLANTGSTLKDTEELKAKKKTQKRQASIGKRKVMEASEAGLPENKRVNKRQKMDRVQKSNWRSEPTKRPTDGASKKGSIGRPNGVRKSERIHTAKHKETEKLNEEAPKQANGGKEMTEKMELVSPISNKQDKNGIRGHQLQDFTETPRKRCPNSAKTKTSGTSERRIRIMQNLGLTAPSGSPFKN